MSSLRSPDEREDETGSAGVAASGSHDEGRTVTLEGVDATLDVPADATRAEAAAVAAAVGAHLEDRRRAAAAAVATDDRPDYVDQWKLAGRLGIDRRSRLPADVERGQVWRAADRTRF